MTTGGSGMNIGDDYVAARIAIDVPQEGIQGVRELTEGIERFRTSMEATTRSEADMTRYLDQMTDSAKRATEAQANLTQQLQTYLQLQGRASGANYSSGVPAGTMQQPWDSGTAGMAPPGSRQPSPTDVAWQLRGMASGNPHEHLNMQQSRGGVTYPDTVELGPNSIAALSERIGARDRAASHQAGHAGGGRGGRGGGAAPHPPTDPYAHLSQRINSGAGLAGSIMNEIGGGNGVGFGQLALQGLNWGRNQAITRSQKANAPSSGSSGSGGGGQGGTGSGGGGGMGGGADPSGGGDGGEEESQGIGSLAKGLGISGGAVAAGLAVFGLVQKGGALAQSWREIGVQRGGGASEGFQASVRARLGALDPSISTEQSREIQQALISQGFSNGTFGSGTKEEEFYTRAIKDFGLSVGQATEFIKATSKFTLLSQEATTHTLDVIKELSKGGWLSNAEAQQLAFGRTDQAINSGVNPSQALTNSLQETYAWNDSTHPRLAGTLAQATPNTVGQSQEWQHGGANGGPVEGIPKGLLPNQIGLWLQNNGKADEARLNSLKYWAGVFHKQWGSPKKDDPIALNARGQFYTYVQQTYPGSPWAQSRGVSDDLYNSFVYEGSTGAKVLGDAKAAIVKENAKDLQFREAPSGDYGIKGSGQSNTSIPIFGDTRKAYGSGVLDRVLKAYKNDVSQIEVGSGGKWEKLDTSNPAMVAALSAGKIKWRHKGDQGQGITLAETPQDIGEKFTTDDPLNSQGTDAKGPSQGQNVTIGLSDEAKRLFKIEDQTLSPNSKDANAGRGDAQLNNPPSTWDRATHPWDYLFQ